MSNVVELQCITRLDLPVQRILAKATAADLREVVIVGLGPDGKFWFASSKADGGDVLWLLEIAKKRLLEIMDDNTDGHPTDPPQGGS